MAPSLQVKPRRPSRTSRSSLPSLPFTFLQEQSWRWAGGSAPEAASPHRRPLALRVGQVPSQLLARRRL